MSDAKNRKTQPFGALVASGKSRLTIVGGPCPHGLTYTLAGTEHRIGRKTGDVILSEDATVSSKHAKVTQADGRVTIADEGSANGIFVRIRGPRALQNGEFLRVGSQLFRFDEIDARESFDDGAGTQFFTSPRRKGTFRLLQILEGGLGGLSASSSNDEITIGGEGSTIAFNADANLSARHARIARGADGKVTVEDLGSTNGTYVKAAGETALHHGDYLFIGQSLLRVDLT
jgi:pSer/pThr/pTyr-binding forkhead associated (FHA) protein